MKTLFKLTFLFLGLNFGLAQQIDYSLDGGYIAEGHDVVAYFSNKVEKGSSKYTTTYDGAKFKFSSQAHLDTFKANAKKYVPQYGGYCAYAMATASKKADADPETYEIRDGKLFMFYNSWGINNLKKWIAENPKVLKPKADANWAKVKYKK